MGSIYPMISGSSSFGNPAHPRCWLPADGSSGRVQGEACRGSLDWWQFSGWWFQYMDYYNLLYIIISQLGFLFPIYGKPPVSFLVTDTYWARHTKYQSSSCQNERLNWSSQDGKTKGHTQVAKNNRANIPSVCCLVFSYISPHTHTYTYIYMCVYKYIYHQLQSGTHT